MERVTIRSRLRNAWNAFTGNRDPTIPRQYYGEANYRRPDRARFSRGNDRTIATAIYNRIAMDAASVDIRHVRLDEHGRYLETIKSGLNDCFTVAANIDQTAREFKQDIVMSMLDEGAIAIVPTSTSDNPRYTDSYDIFSMRVGKIITWYPKHVKLEVYNEDIGRKEEITLPKSVVTIVYNPLYSVVNEHNSMMQRLVRKLALLDQIDEQSSAGKLDMIIQLPYIIKTDARRQQAEDRRKQIEEQLRDSKFGIAYTDGTERITQLNRPLENNLMSQIEYLTSMLYGQLGMTTTVMDGTADEKTMLNYNNRTIEPILTAIVEGMIRTWLTKTARTQGQSIMFFRDPFRLVPVSEIAKIADTFARNEIMSSNEIRQVIGLKPSLDPKADQLVNSNMPQPNGMMAPEGELPPEYYEEGGIGQNGEI